MRIAHPWEPNLDSLCVGMCPRLWTISGFISMCHEIFTASSFRANWFWDNNKGSFEELPFRSKKISEKPQIWQIIGNKEKASFGRKSLKIS